MGSAAETASSAQSGIDLAEYAKSQKIKYFMISYTDLFGGQRAKLVPAQAIRGMQEDGAGFAGFATWLDMTPAHPDMLAVPDPASVIQLPWKPEVAWVASDCIMEGKLVGQAPRNTLKRLMASAAEAGCYVKTGVEAEFFLITPDGKAISDPADTAGQAVLRPAGRDAALRRHRGNMRLHAFAWLGRLPKRPRGRERPVRDELGFRSTL